MNAVERKERQTAWAMLILCPLSMMIVFVYVTLGYAPGLASGHPVEYLQMTCVLWAVITMVLPILRLIKVIAIPLWLTVLLYADIYLYVLSLVQGMYLDMSWWGNTTHVIAAVVVASMVFVALCLVQAYSPEHVTLGSRGGIIAIMMFASMSFGAIWEIMEGCTDIISGKEYMQYSASDTLGDLGADLVGVAIMMIIAWIVLGRQDAKKIASTIRLGKNTIDVGE